MLRIEDYRIEAEAESEAEEQTDEVWTDLTGIQAGVYSIQAEYRQYSISDMASGRENRQLE